MAVADVLILRALGVGDLLTGVPAIRAIRREFPRARMRLATAAGLGDLVAMIGGIDDVVPTSGLAAMEFRGRRPDLAVNLHGRGPQSNALLRRTAPAAQWNHREPGTGAGGPEWADGLHEVDRWCRLLRYHGVAADPADLRIPPPRRAPIAGAIVVHPGASSPARRWPAVRFGVVARRLARAHGGPVVVTGGPAERALVDRVCREAGSDVPVRRSGAYSLADLAAVISQARLVICGDTGIAHVATAFATPSVVLFGPTAPQCWGPRIDAGRHTVLWAGRRGDPHADSVDPGLVAIGTDAVVQAAAAQLQRGRDD